MKWLSLKSLVIRKKTVSKANTLDLGRADVRLLKELVSKVSWESAFEGIGVHKCWSILKTPGAGNSSVSKCMDVGSKVKLHRRTTEMQFATVGKKFF